MKKVSLLKLLTFVMLLSLVSCKDDDEEIVKLPEECKLSGLEVVGTESYAIAYDANNRLLKTTIDKVSGPDMYEEYEYNTAGKLSKYKMFNQGGSQIDYFALEYNNDGLLRKESYFWRVDETSPYQHEYDRIYEYNSAKQLIKASSYEPGQADVAGSQPGMFSEYTYDAAGNVTKIKEFVWTDNGPVNNLITEYTYDSKKNPWQNLVQFGGTVDGISKNNIVTEKETNVLSGQVKNYTLTYLYNENNFPTKQTTTLSNGNTKVINLNYACF